MDAITLLRERIRKTEGTRSKYKKLGDLNEQFCSGYQWGAVALHGGLGGVVFEQDAWAVGLPKIWSNRVAPLWNKWASLIVGDQPTAAARAATDDPLDAYRAATGNKALEYLRSNVNSVEKISQTVRYAGQHGTAGLKVTFDNAEDEVVWQVLTIFGYHRDPKEDPRDAKWCIFESLISEDEAKARLKKAKIKTPPNVAKRFNALGEELEGVLLYEMYEKPCDGYADGRFVVVIDDSVVVDEVNPYVFQRKGKQICILPLFLMKVRNQRDSPYGHTPVTDMISLQRTFNEALADHVLRMRMSKPSLLLPADMMAAYSPFKSATIPIPKGQEEQSKAARWTDAPTPSQDIYQLQELLKAEMLAVIGINDTTAGQAERAQSGAAINALTDLDKLQNGDCSTSMKSMVLEAFRFSLLLIIEFMSDAKKAEIAAETKAAIDLFDTADVYGLDLILQVSAEAADLEKSKPKPSTGIAMQRARGFVRDFIASAYSMPLPDDVDGQAVVDAVDAAKAIALQKGDREEFAALHKLQAEAAQHIAAVAPDPDAVNPQAVVDPPPAEGQPA